MEGLFIKSIIFLVFYLVKMTINKDNVSIPSLSRIPASAAQELFFFAQRLQPKTTAYNIPSVFRINGPLEVPSLERSLNELRLHHEIFRTTIEFRGNHSYQIVTPHEMVLLKVIDISQLHQERKQTECNRCIREEIRLPFELSTGPLFRSVLIKLSPLEHVLIITAHHTIIDLKTKDLIGNELSELYAYYISRGGETRNQKQDQKQYAKFARWQREWMKGSECASMLEYWLKILTDRPAFLDLPTDYSRPAAQSLKGEHFDVHFNTQVTKQLKKFSRKENVNVFLILLTVYAILLRRYTSQDAVNIGVPFTNRRRKEIKDGRGCFMNILPIYLDFETGDTFRTVLRKIRMAILGAHRNQEIPFGTIVRKLTPARDLSHNPIYQVGFTFEHPMQISLSGLIVEPIFYHSGGAQLDLFAKFCETNEHIRGYFEYSIDLFNVATIQRFTENFKALLDSILDTPDCPINKLHIMPKSSMEKIVHSWNQTERNYGRPTCLHYLFEKQAEKSPGKMAVSFEGTSLNYQELNVRANQLAHYLRKCGVHPDVPVGVYMNRSVEMVVSLFGILKSGGAYVPLDPEYPATRLSDMVSDSRTPVILSQADLSKRLPKCDAKFISIDSDWEIIAQHSAANPEPTAKPNNLAYLIYTSGSTGNPKGVMIEHAGICNRLYWMQETFNLNATDRVLQKTPFSFDVSVWEFFWPLLFGAELVMASPGAHKDPNFLSAAIVDHDITTIHFVPSMLDAYITSTGFRECKSLRRVICSGEALPFDLTKRFYQCCDAELHNLYGPTEASVDVTHWPVPRKEIPQIIPIGKPIANTVAYILDRNMQPVPIGVPGELFIGGIQLARGYLDRPEIDAEQFVSDPFANSKDSLLYKTGDLVKFLPTGDIIFLGRNDFQVKIRGNRVELGEIEETLRLHELIHDCVVITNKSPTGGTRLVAYFIPKKQKKHPTESELRSFLSSYLPSYMVPSFFVLLSEIPYTISGKVDRRKLPKPTSSTAPCKRTYEGSTSGLEATIAGIWSDVLCIDKVLVNENFFSLGGDSLLSIEVIRRLEKVLGFSIGVLRLFQFPTVRLLTEFLTQKYTLKTDAKDAKRRAFMRRESLMRRNKSTRSIQRKC